MAGFQVTTEAVSRRLALAEVLPEPIQQQMREGKMVAQPDRAKHLPLRSRPS
jgi:hypothetical protein